MGEDPENAILNFHVFGAFRAWFCLQLRCVRSHISGPNEVIFSYNIPKEREINQLSDWQMIEGELGTDL